MNADVTIQWAVENGIPVSGFRDRNPIRPSPSLMGLSHALRSLKKGQSLFVPADMWRVSAAVSQCRIRYGNDFILRTVDGGTRVWAK